MLRTDCTGILVTRGDIDLLPITQQIAAAGIADIIVYDNSQAKDVACFGRWCATQDVTTKYVYMQDDDVLVPRHSIEALMRSYDAQADDHRIVANMGAEWRKDESDPEFGYHDMALEACGAVMRRDVWEPAVIEYLSKWPEDRFFYEWADFVVGIGTPHRKLDLPVTIRDNAYLSRNLANTGGNRARRKAMMRRCRRTFPLNGSFPV